MFAEPLLRGRRLELGHLYPQWVLVSWSSGQEPGLWQLGYLVTDLSADRQYCNFKSWLMSSKGLKRAVAAFKETTMGELQTSQHGQHSEQPDRYFWILNEKTKSGPKGKTSCSNKNADSCGFWTWTREPGYFIYITTMFATNLIHDTDECHAQQTLLHLLDLVDNVLCFLHLFQQEADVRSGVDLLLEN